MPTQTELEFYKAFGIEPDHYETCLLECKPDATLEDFKKNGCDKKDTCPHNKVEDFYPEITDRRLLELICQSNIFVSMNFYSITAKQLKIEVLEMLAKEYNKTQKQALYHKVLYHEVRKIMGVE